MGLDLNFYKKDYKELSFKNIGDRPLFEDIRKKVTYGNEEYGEYIRLNKRQINHVVKCLGKHNEYGEYNSLIGEIMSCKEKNEAVYFEADW